MVLAAVVLFGAVQVAGAADTQTAQAQYIDQFAPPKGDGVLYVDGDHIYPGMESNYANGYAPVVNGDTANVVLPLVTGSNTSGIAGDAVSLSVYLGKPSEAPFKFNNYDKAVKWSPQTVKDAAGADTTVNAFLATFDLQLEPVEKRNIGKYPVVITARYNLASGSAVTQNFLVYVTIEEGNDPNAPAPEPEPEIPIEPDNGGGIDGGGIDSGGGGGGGAGVSSQPKVFISNYTVSPEEVYAGELFTVTVTVRNSSKTSAVKNMTVTYKSETADMLPGNGTNTAYIEKIAKDSTADFSFTMEARADAKPGPQKVLMNISYEDGSSTPLTAEDEVTVQVRQRIRLEYDQPSISPQFYMGDTFSVSLNLYNKGKNVLYNVTVAFDAPGMVPDSSAFLGNMESGTAKTADIYGTVASGMPAVGMEEGGDLGMEDAAAAPLEREGEVTVIEGAQDNSVAAEEGGQIILDGEEVTVSGEEIPGFESASPGPVEGNFVVTYEDEYGDEYELLVPVSTTLLEMPDYSGDLDPEGELPEEEQAGFPWWGWVIIAAAAVVAVVAAVRTRAKKKRAQELAEDMEDMDNDDLS